VIDGFQAPIRILVIKAAIRQNSHRCDLSLRLVSRLVSQIIRNIEVIFCIDRMWREASGLESGEDSRREGRAIWRMAMAGVGPRSNLARPLYKEQMRRCAYH